MKSKSMKIAMKATKKSMKTKTTMKKRKAKKVSPIARGKNRRAQVFKGSKEKTGGGLKKSDITRNKNGNYVSKKKMAFGQKLKFPKAVLAARKALGIKGFVPIGGKTAKGQALLKKARSIYKKK